MLIMNRKFPYFQFSLCILADIPLKTLENSAFPI